MINKVVSRAFEPDSDDSASDARLLELTRVAWLYHVEGLTQEQIARQLGTHRLRVQRLLARCRQDGIVQVSIRSPLIGILELEKELVDVCGLRSAIVVPSPGDAAATPDVLGAAIAHYLNRRLGPNMSIGMVPGRALYGALNAIEPDPLTGLTIVTLTGALTRRAALLPWESAYRLAHLHKAECYFIPAPTYADSERARNKLLSQPLVNDIVRMAESVNIAILGAGRLNEQSVMRSYDLIDRADVIDLEKAGAVGTLAGWFLNDKGELIDHALNKRVVALPLERVKRISEKVLYGGGRSKVAALTAVLRGNFADILITDEIAARKIISNFRSGR